MYFVYILKSEKDNNIYIGKTNDLRRRVSEHNRGKVSSTKARRPFVVLEYTECKTEQEALALEKEYKKGYLREGIRRKYKL